MGVDRQGTSAPSLGAPSSQRLNMCSPTQKLSEFLLSGAFMAVLLHTHG